MEQETVHIGEEPLNVNIVRRDLHIFFQVTHTFHALTMIRILENCKILRKQKRQVIQNKKNIQL